MGAEFTGEHREGDNVPSGKPAVQYGINGKVKQADNTKAASGSTPYHDRVSNSTVKRKGSSTQPWSYKE